MKSPISTPVTGAEKTKSRLWMAVDREPIDGAIEENATVGKEMEAVHEVPVGHMERGFPAVSVIPEPAAFNCSK